MQIIPVIDIRGGIVVLAKGGDRKAYPPLESVVTDSVNVMQVIRDLCFLHPFQQIYIADLDAIETSQHNTDYYRDLASEFPDLELWVDAGVKTAMDIKHYLKIPSVKVVLGSETLASLNTLEQFTDCEDLILSLDKRQGRLLGDSQLLQRPDLWTQKTIAMDLDAVGAGHGPGLTWLEDLIDNRVDIDWFAAGGVRNKTDLEALAEIKVAGVLVASALHTGQIDKQMLKQMEQVHCPSEEGQCGNKL